MTQPDWKCPACGDNPRRRQPCQNAFGCIHANEPCIALAIWELAIAVHPVTDTAQQRHALDQILRRELAKITDRGLRAHAAEIIRQQRQKRFRLSNDHPRIPQLEARIATLEGMMGIAQPDTEIKSIRRGQAT
ncbi:hypothetical protein [Roseinatronobacter sp.]